jgi:hypothetical protein
MTAYGYPVDPATLGQDFGQFPGGYNPPGGHTGKDFKVWTGTPVHAAGDGVVVQAQDSASLPAEYRQDGSGPNPYWINPDFAGKYIALDHGLTAPASIYAHLSEIYVKPGQRVTKGQLIGLSGATGGASSGPHLHFEMLPPNWDFDNGTYGRVDPARYCSGQASLTIQPESTSVAPLKGFLMALTDKQQTDFYNRVMRYLDAPVSTVPKKVWGITIRRGGKDISALQELADAKTLIQRQQATIDALTKAVGALQAAQMVAGK